MHDGEESRMTVPVLAKQSSRQSLTNLVPGKCAHVVCREAGAKGMAATESDSCVGRQSQRQNV